VEFLKGPAAILYGGGQPGGVVNFLTRMPQAQPSTFAEFQLGSFDLYRFVADSTGPVGDSNSLFYRGTVALENSHSFREFGLLQRVLATPSFTWVIDQATTLTVQAEFLYTRLFFDTGVVAPGGIVGLVPISESFNEPDDFWHEDDYRISFFFDHRLDDHWTARLAASSFWFPAELQRTLPVAFVTPDTLLRLKQFASSASEQYHSIIPALMGKFSTGPFNHQVLFGSELGWVVVPDFQLRQSNPFVTPMLLNIFDPIYRNAAFGAPDPPLPFRIGVNEEQTRYGFYAQDLIDLHHHWYLLVGGRYDIVHNQFIETANIPLGFPVGGIAPLQVPRVTRTDPTYDHWSGRAGLVWQPISEVLAFYGSYSQSFNPVFGARSDSMPLVPETGFQWEGGLKADLLDKKLTFTAAGFFIVRDNVAVPDPTKDLFFFRQVGQERSQGAELSLVGKLADNWSIIANYAYIDTKVLDDLDPMIVGKRFLSVPLNSGNLWTRYNLLQRTEQTFGVALGLVGIGERPGDLANTFTLPAYARWDAGLYYQRRNLSVSLYFENIFDVQYYAGSVSIFQIIPGAPFNVRGALRWAF
jgi:iron complex outermembrane receptor protein